MKWTQQQPLAFNRSLKLFHALEKLFGIFKALCLGFIDYTWHRCSFICLISRFATVAFSCGRLRNWWKFCAIKLPCSISFFRGMIAATASLARRGSGIVGIVALGLAMASNFQRCCRGFKEHMDIPMGFVLRFERLRLH